MTDVDGKTTGALAAAARGALVGMVGGLVAGAADFGAAYARAASFLPHGRLRLLGFLCTFYGATFAAAGALVGVMVVLFGRASDLGPWWRLTTRADAADAADGARLSAYVVAALGLLAGAGAVLHVVVLRALLLFHQPLLIAALVAAAANGLILGGALLLFPLARLLSWVPVLRSTRPVRLRPATATATVLVFLGFAVGSGAVGLFVRSLLDRPRMSNPLRALNAGLWSPALLAGGIVVALLMVRIVRSKVSQPTSPLKLTAAALLGLGLLPLGFVAYGWTIVRQLDGRPFAAIGVAVGTAVLALLFGVGRSLPSRPLLARLAVALLLPGLLFSGAMRLARADRVRKAALTFTGLSPPLVLAAQKASDFDGDGYSSLTSLGGGDCNDFDARIHPGAFDWPDDGIDQDCNGFDATMPAAHTRKKWPLPATVARNPNVMLITIDALRADHVGSYGYPRPTSPNLDALAAESTRFAHAWSHAPSTRYSMPAILSGLYPLNVAVGSQAVHWPQPILPENHLVAEMMKELGYFTGATVSYYYFERAWGLDQGFDDYDDHLKYLHSGAGVAPSETHGTSARELADLDIAFIQKHQAEKFFLWTHYYDTHFDFMRHAEPETHFGNQEVDVYDGEIRFTDIHLGRVFAELKKAGLWDKTIIIVTADHGDGFGEHGIPKDKRHGYHLYKNETSVPLLIHVPGLPARVVDEPVGHIDIVPTLLDLLDVADGKEPQLMGESLLGLMTGTQSEPDRHVFQEVDYEGPTERRAVVNHDWHYIKNVIPDATAELYHLTTDPLEEHDLSGDGEAEEQKLRAQLAVWMDAINMPRDFARRVTGNLASHVLPFAQPLGDQIGTSIALDGVTIGKPSIARAEPLTLDLVMHGLGTVPSGWRLFTHVVGANGRLMNADHEPLEGFFPVGELHANQWLRDHMSITLPRDWPLGPTTVEMGLWRGGARAPTTGSHAATDNVRIATVTVTP